MLQQSEEEKFDFSKFDFSKLQVDKGAIAFLQTDESFYIVPSCLNGPTVFKESDFDYNETDNVDIKRDRLGRGVRENPIIAHNLGENYSMFKGEVDVEDIDIDNERVYRLGGIPLSPLKDDMQRFMVELYDYFSKNCNYDNEYEDDFEDVEDEYKSPIKISSNSADFDVDLLEEISPNSSDFVIDLLEEIYNGFSEPLDIENQSQERQSPSGEPVVNENETIANLRNQLEEERARFEEELDRLKKQIELDRSTYELAREESGITPGAKAEALQQEPPILQEEKNCDEEVDKAKAEAKQDCDDKLTKLQEMEEEKYNSKIKEIEDCDKKVQIAENKYNQEAEKARIAVINLAKAQLAADAAENAKKECDDNIEKLQEKINDFEMENKDREYLKEQKEIDEANAAKARAEKEAADAKSKLAAAEEEARKLEKARLEALKKAEEEKTKLVAAQKAREEAEQKAREEAEQKAREEAEKQAREDAEKQAKEEAEQQAREEAEQQARLKAEAEQQAREEEEQARLKAEKLAEQERLREEEEKAREVAEKQAREETRELAEKLKKEQEQRDAENKAKEENVDYEWLQKQKDKYVTVTNEIDTMLESKNLQEIKDFIETIKHYDDDRENNIKKIKEFLPSILDKPNNEEIKNLADEITKTVIPDFHDKYKKLIILRDKLEISKLLSELRTGLIPYEKINEITLKAWEKQSENNFFVNKLTKIKNLILTTASELSVDDAKNKTEIESIIENMNIAVEIKRLIDEIEKYFISKDNIIKEVDNYRKKDTVDSRKGLLNSNVFVGNMLKSFKNYNKFLETITEYKKLKTEYEKLKGKLETENIKFVDSLLIPIDEKMKNMSDITETLATKKNDPILKNYLEDDGHIKIGLKVGDKVQCKKFKNRKPIGKLLNCTITKNWHDETYDIKYDDDGTTANKINIKDITPGGDTLNTGLIKLKANNFKDSNSKNIFYGFNKFNLKDDDEKAFYELAHIFLGPEPSVNVARNIGVNTKKGPSKGKKGGTQKTNNIKRNITQKSHKKRTSQRVFRKLKTNISRKVLS